MTSLDCLIAALGLITSYLLACKAINSLAQEKREGAKFVRLVLASIVFVSSYSLTLTILSKVRTLESVHYASNKSSIER